MSTRNTLTRLALPLLGAAAVTAGAVLVQIARKPSPETARAQPAGGHPASSAPEKGTTSLARALGTEASVPYDDSFLRRLREHGL